MVRLQYETSETHSLCDCIVIYCVPALLSDVDVVA